MAVQAVICSLLEMNDTEAALLLQQYRSRVTPDENVITAVREMLKTREFQYVPLRLKDINDLLLQTSVNFPTMFLIHLKGTFHYAIFSSLGNQYFDDTRGESSILTPENLYCSLDQNNENDLRLNAASSLEIVKGYVFTKKQKTSVKQKEKKRWVQHAMSNDILL
jgi:hypothetical protein